MIRFLYELFTNRCYIHGDRLCEVVAGPFCKKCDAEADARKWGKK